MKSKSKYFKVISLCFAIGIVFSGHIFSSSKGNENIDHNHKFLKDNSVCNNSNKENPISFVLSKFHLVNIQPHSIVFGNITGKNKVNLAVSGTAKGKGVISFFNASKDGHFIKENILESGERPSSFFAVDINGDEIAEIVSIDFEGNKFLIHSYDLKSKKHLSPKSFKLPNKPKSYTVGDFNNDGNKDIAFSFYDTGVITIFNNENGSDFVESSTFNLGLIPESISSADIDLDGDLDIVVVSSKESKINIYSGDGNSSYRLVKTIYLENSPSKLIYEDFNNDKHLDIIAASEINNNFAIIISNDENFKKPIYFDIPGSLKDIVAVDVNSDCNLDVVVAQINPFAISVCKGSSDGKLSPSEEFSFGDVEEGKLLEKVSLSTIDINSDDKVDFAISSKDLDEIIFVIQDDVDVKSEKVEEIISRANVKSRQHQCEPLCVNSVVECCPGTVFMCLGENPIRFCSTTGEFASPLCLDLATSVIRSGECVPVDGNVCFPSCENGSTMCCPGTMFACPNETDTLLCQLTGDKIPFCVDTVTPEAVSQGGIIRSGLCVPNVTTGGDNCVEGLPFAMPFHFIDSNGLLDGNLLGSYKLYQDTISRLDKKEIFLDGISLKEEYDFKINDLVSVSYNKEELDIKPDERLCGNGWCDESDGEDAINCSADCPIHLFEEKSATKRNLPSKVRVIKVLTAPGTDESVPDDEASTDVEETETPDDTIVEVCGNGILEGSEVCDDGNVDDNDGCDSSCSTVEDDPSMEIDPYIPPVTDPPPPDDTTPEDPAIVDPPPPDDTTPEDPAIVDPPPPDDTTPEDPAIVDPPPPDDTTPEDPAIVDPPPPDDTTPEDPPIEDPTPEETSTPEDPPIEDPTPEETSTPEDPPIEDPTPEETSTPDPTSTPTATPTPTDTPTSTPTTTATPTPTDTPTSTPTTTATPTPTDTPTSTPTATPTPTDTPISTPTATATPTIPALVAPTCLPKSKFFLSDYDNSAGNCENDPTPNPTIPPSNANNITEQCPVCCVPNNVSSNNALTPTRGTTLTFGNSSLRFYTDEGDELVLDKPGIYSIVSDVMPQNSNLSMFVSNNNSRLLSGNVNWMDRSSLQVANDCRISAPANPGGGGGSNINFDLAKGGAGTKLTVTGISVPASVTITLGGDFGNRSRTTTVPADGEVTFINMPPDVPYMATTDDAKVSNLPFDGTTAMGGEIGSLALEEGDPEEKEIEACSAEPEQHVQDCPPPDSCVVMRVAEEDVDCTKDCNAGPRAFVEPMEGQPEALPSEDEIFQAYFIPTDYSGDTMLMGSVHIVNQNDEIVQVKNSNDEDVDSIDTDENGVVAFSIPFPAEGDTYTIEGTFVDPDDSDSIPYELQPRNISPQFPTLLGFEVPVTRSKITRIDLDELLEHTDNGLSVAYEVNPCSGAFYEFEPESHFTYLDNGQEYDGDYVIAEVSNFGRSLPNTMAASNQVSCGVNGTLTSTCDTSLCQYTPEPPKEAEPEPENMCVPIMGGTVGQFESYQGVTIAYGDFLENGEDVVATLVRDNNGNGNIAFYEFDGMDNNLNQISYLGTRLENPDSLSVTDINNDNLNDFVVTSSKNQKVELIVGGPNSQFTRTVFSAFTPNTLTSTIAHTVLNHNNDGIPDLAVIGKEEGILYIHDGDVDGSAANNRSTFRTSSPNASSRYREVSGFSNPTSVTSLSANNDDRDDLIVINEDSLSILLTEQDGSFTRMNNVLFSVMGAPVVVENVDLNNDGNSDLITLVHGEQESDNGSVVISLGDGAGNFTEHEVKTVGIKPTALKVGDINNDNKLDLVVAHEGSSELSILKGKGNATFDDEIKLETGLSSLRDLVLADLNDDSKLDIVVIGDGKNPDGSSGKLIALFLNSYCP